MRKILLLAAVIFSGIAVYANPVDLTKAKTIAKDFFAAKGAELTKTDVPLKAPRKGAAQQADAYYYVFNADDNRGYVIVSGDDRTEKILGYADSGSIDFENMPENMRSWLQFYADRIKYLDDNNIQTAPETSEAKNLRKGGKAHHSIAPLLTCNWNQGDPYNLQCPEYYNGDGSIGGRSATGCVATAIAQVLYFHKYPAETKGRIPSHVCKWTLDNNTTKTFTMPAIKAGTEIDWDNMCDNYYGSETQEQKDAVAFLMKLVGQSVKMGYGASSGSSYADSRKLFVDYLGYDDGVQILRSDNYGIQEWVEMMYEELDKGYPIAYGGSSTGGGHAFVVDGFDGDEFFHLNWGWGGGSNGYFRIDVLNPGDNSGIGASSSADGYSMGQDAIMYLRGFDDGVDAGYEADTHASMNDLTINGTKIFLNYVNWTGSANSFNTAIVTKNEEGEIVPVAGQETISNLGANYYVGKTVDMAGKFQEPGTYRITPANKLTSNKIWRTLFNLRDEYIRADVDEELKVTLTRVSPTIDLEVTDWFFPGTLKSGDQQDVTVRLKNNGTEFKRELALYASKTDNKGNSVSRALIGVKSGATDDFTFFFKPTTTGTYNLWLTLNSDKNTVIGQTTVEIKSTAQNTAKLRFSSLTVSNNGIGNRALGNVNIENKASTAFNGRVKLQLWVKATDSNMFWSSSSTQVAVNVEAGKSAAVPYEFNNLEPNRTYIMCAYYSQGGELENAGLTYDHSFSTKNGLLYWHNYGTIAGVSQATSYTVPAAACGLLIDNATFKKLTPNKNPNTIYSISEGTYMPEGIEGHNVVVGKRAEQITLTSDNTFVIPTSFVADNATYSHTFTATCDGTMGYSVITLPFAPDKITVDDVEMDIFCGDIYMKEFYSEDDMGTVFFATPASLRGGTPYLIGCTESLVGKTVVFSAENAEFKSADSDNMLVSSENFSFHGVTCTPRLNGIYMLNEEGSAFTLYTGSTKKAISGGYFTTKLSDELRPQSIVIQDDANGIKVVTVTTDDKTYNTAGQRINNDYKGIIIRNGKKYINK